jgi:nitroreductase
VPDSQVQEAVSYAINSPSVCNRQSWKVRVYSDAVGVETALSFQNGNKGFGAVPAVAIITSDLKLFSGPGERNQAWIEGGIFGMSVVWALHALRIDSCMLNFSEGNRQGDALRRSLDISDSEVIVMMIAMGYGAEGVRVARSPHRSIDEILTFESIRRPPTSRGEAATGRA